MPSIPLNFWIIARLAEAGGVQIGRDITDRYEPGTIPMMMGIAGGFVLIASLLLVLLTATRKS